MEPGEGGEVYILYKKNQKKRVQISSPGLSFLQTAALRTSCTEIPGPSMGTRPDRRVGGRRRWFLGDAWVPGVPLVGKAPGPGPEEETRAQHGDRALLGQSPGAVASTRLRSARPVSVPFAVFSKDITASDDQLQVFG